MPNIDEVSFMRPILILLLVLYHAMCIHTGNWDVLSGIDVIPAYEAIGRLVYSFMLESFVFISGYVWAYQREGLGRITSFYSLLKKKFERLIVPEIVFGFFYVILVDDCNFTLRTFIIGPGHLWFLPMLFCCFLISWFILEMKIRPEIVIILLFFVSAFSDIKLPLRFSYIMYFMLFFMVGYYSYTWFMSIKGFVKIQMVFFLWLMFVSVYILFGNDNIHEVGKINVILYSLTGTMAFYITGLFVTQIFKLNKYYIQFGSLCLGIYIFQQFVLKVLYYKTIFPYFVDSLYLPWLSFMIALTISVVLTMLIRTTKVGNKIL